MLSERGYKGSASELRRIIRSRGLRPSPSAEAFHQLQTLPGEEAQVDWAHLDGVRVGDTERRVYALLMVLSHSRALHVGFYLEMKTNAVLEAHTDAFRFFGGVPRKIIYDGMKTAVLERQGRLPDGTNTCSRAPTTIAMNRSRPACDGQQTRAALSAPCATCAQACSPATPSTVWMGTDVVSSNGAGRLPIRELTRTMRPERSPRCSTMSAGVYSRFGARVRHRPDRHRARRQLRTCSLRDEPLLGAAAVCPPSTDSAHQQRVGARCFRRRGRRRAPPLLAAQTNMDTQRSR